MCLAVPRKVVTLSGNKATLQDGRVVRLDLIKGVKEGDYVIVSADLAVEKITEAKAQKMSSLLSDE